MYHLALMFSRLFFGVGQGSLQSWIGRSPLVSTLALTLALLTPSPSTAQPIQAQSSPPPPPFTDVGQPSDSGPAGSRGENCAIAEDRINREIIPLLPAGNQGGWTTASDPSIWVYLPFGLRSDYEARLFVETFRTGEDGAIETETIARQRFQMQDTQPGIHFFPVLLTDEQFPATPVPTATSDPSDFSTAYRWTLKISCDFIGNEPTEISGTMRRVGIDASNHPGWSADNPIGFSTAYADHHVWYDALTILGRLRLTELDNGDYVAAWQQLLSYPTVGLEAIANEPLINCCTIETE